ncbi:hypothetical protein JHK85_025118 [Glycine max]|nr:hypothetical protein JHK85_025118 [Glycine max]
MAKVAYLLKRKSLIDPSGHVLRNHPPPDAPPSHSHRVSCNNIKTGMDAHTWVAQILKHKDVTLMITVCWWAWRWRSKFIFESQHWHISHICSMIRSHVVDPLQLRMCFAENIPCSHK